MPDAPPPIHCRVDPSTHLAFQGPHVHACTRQSTIRSIISMPPYYCTFLFTRFAYILTSCVCMCDVTGLNTYSFVFSFFYLRMTIWGCRLTGTHETLPRLLLSLVRFFVARSPRHLPRVHVCSRSKAPHLSPLPLPSPQETK